MTCNEDYQAAYPFTLVFSKSLPHLLSSKEIAPRKILECGMQPLQNSNKSRKRNTPVFKWSSLTVNISFGSKDFFQKWGFLLPRWVVFLVLKLYNNLLLELKSIVQLVIILSMGVLVMSGLACVCAILCFTYVPVQPTSRVTFFPNTNFKQLWFGLKIFNWSSRLFYGGV